MAHIQAEGKVREQSISAVITRADGRRINVGVVSYYSANPLKRLVWAIKKHTIVKYRIYRANRET